MDILIKGMEMPSEGKIINLTICSDGSVINNLPDAGGKMSSYRSERVKAVALPEHGSRCVETNAVVSAITKCFADCKAKGIKPTPFIMSVYIGKVPTILEANYGTDN